MSEVVDVYLDVDGVLNAITPSTPDDWGWGESKVIRANGFDIRYSPELVERLNALAARPDVQFYWLTTWLADAPRLIADGLGLHGQDWPVIGTEHYLDSPMSWRVWWKLKVIQEYFPDSGRRAVWVDDDLPWDATAQRWAKPYVDEGRLLLVQPRTYRSLTLPEMARIEQWVTNA